jgi:hypothetical protein
MAKKIQRKFLFLAGLIGLGLISLAQGVFQGFSNSADTNKFSQGQLKNLLSVEKASADTPYSQSYYQGYYQDYYQDYYQNYYQDTYGGDNGGSGAAGGSSGGAAGGESAGEGAGGACPGPDGGCK